MFKRTEWVERPPAASTLASTTVPEHPQTASTEASKPPATQSSPSAEVPLPATLPSSYLPLSAQFPTSSPQALLRFATAYPKNNGKDAIAPYKAHLKWRETTFPIIAHDPELFYPREHDKVFPKKYLTVGGTARDGTLLIMVQGAMYDVERGGVQGYVDACAHALDTMFPDAGGGDVGKITLLIDIRGFDKSDDVDFRNCPATQMIPFFRACSKTLSANYPDRLEKIVLYTIPWFLAGVVNLVRKVLPRELNDKFVILAGKNARDTPKGLWEIVDEEMIHEMKRKYHVNVV